MRGLVLLVAACGGAPDVPAHLEEIGAVPQLFQDTAAAFDAADRFVVMDSSTGLRRLNGSRLDAVPGGAAFTFGSMGVDRDGTLLLASFNTGQLTRLEANDVFVPITPTPPGTILRSMGAPSGAYHVLLSSSPTTFVLPVGGTEWTDSMRKLDRTARAPDGEIYAIIDGDVARLGADDSAVPLASCADFAGGVCMGLELAGTDAGGHLHMTARGAGDVHVLDPDSATFRHISLPGILEVEAMAAGAEMSVVIATDPQRQNERSLWMLAPGSDQLLRFSALVDTLGSFVRLLADHAGNVYLIANGTLQAVVPN